MEHVCWRSRFDELWTTGEDGAWHFQDGSWTRESIDPDRPGGSVDDLALAPDGTVWAAGADGVAYRRDGRWVVVDDHPAHVITFDRDGTAWAAGSGPRRRQMRHLDAAAQRDAWTHTPLAPCPHGF